MKVLIGKNQPPEKRFTIRWLWEPRDMWVGIFWNFYSGEKLLHDYLFVYISIIPCLPLCFIWRWGLK